MQNNVIEFHKMNYFTLPLVNDSELKSSDFVTFAFCKDNIKPQPNNFW